MGTILEVLDEESRRLVTDRFPFLRYEFETCWYPSCGFDFRHILYYSRQGSKNILYVHSDMLNLDHALSGCGTANPLFGTGDFPDSYNSCLITPLAHHGLKLKENLWWPNRRIASLSQGSENRARVFLFVVIVKANSPEEMPAGAEAATVPILFFSFENTNFFYDYILENRIEISKLIHIKDGGGSMGGSNFPMGYIYQHLDDMRTVEMITEYESCRLPDDFRHNNPRKRRWDRSYRVSDRSRLEDNLNYTVSRINEEVWKAIPLDTEISLFSGTECRRYARRKLNER